MSEPSTAHASLSATGYEDGLGHRTLEFDREAGGMLERLHLRAEFGAFETALRQRMDRLAAFDDARFARVRSVERHGAGTLTVVSPFVPGDRLCDLLDAATSLPAHEATSPSVDGALGFLLEVLPALDAFHATELTHGALEPGRIVLSPSGQVVLLDTLYGQALERLQFNRRRLWSEFGLAMPAAAGPARFDRSADISQACLAAMMIVLGRPLRQNDYPHALPTLVSEVIEIAQIRGSSRFASGLHRFLHRTLPLSTRRAHASAEEAAGEVRQIAREIGVQRCRTALAAFVGDMNRVLTDAREQAAGEYVETIGVPFAVEEPVEVDIAGEPEPQAEEVSEPAQADEILIDDAPDFVGTPAPVVPEAEFAEPVAEPEPPQQIVVPPEPAYTPMCLEESAPAILAEEFPPPARPIADEPAPAPPYVFAAEPAPAPVVVEAPAPSPVIAAVAPASPAFVEWPPAPVAVVEPPQPAPAAAAPEPEPEPAPAESKRKRQNARRHRDKLRSNAIPPARPPAPRVPVYVEPPPLPIVPAAAAALRKVPQPLRDEAPLPVPITPVRVEPAIALQASAPLRLKTEPPSGFTPPPVWSERREPQGVTQVPYVQRDVPESTHAFPWRLAAAALIVIGVGIGAGRAYLPSSDTAQAAPMPSEEVVAAAKAAEAAARVGTVVLTTEPAGAHVLLDGKEVGDSPLTLENVPAGKHALTFVTASASVKKIVRVESGKTVSLDVAVFSGWIAVFSPVPLDIAENGRAIGSSEQGRLMLSPGRHQLTLSNTELGYSTVQTVDIEPGEERPVSVQPTGELSANAVPWAEVWMNGKKIGETPVARLVVPLGTYEVVFKNPQFPDRRVTVTVTGNAPVNTSVDFSK